MKRSVCLSTKQKVLKMQVIVPVLLRAAVLTLWGHSIVQYWAVAKLTITNIHTCSKASEQKHLTIWTFSYTRIYEWCISVRRPDVDMWCLPQLFSTLNPTYPAGPKDPWLCLQSTGVTGRYPHLFNFYVCAPVVWEILCVSAAFIG